MNATQKQHAERRAEARKVAENSSMACQRELRRILKNCGLTNTQISDCSGVSPATVSRFMRYNSQRMLLENVVAFVRAAGYRITFEKLPKESDIFRPMRRFAPDDENK